MSEWEIAQHDEGDTVAEKHHHIDGSLNDDDTRFYALVTKEHTERGRINGDIIAAIQNGPAGAAETRGFVEKIHPFYPYNHRMYALRESDVQVACSNAQASGYDVEVVEETGFCFVPRPTIGEVIVEP